MSSGQTAQDPVWKGKEQSEEARYIHQKEQAQLAAIRSELEAKGTNNTSPGTESSQGAAQQVPREDRDYEAGYGGQEDLEDRYATTRGEH